MAFFSCITLGFFGESWKKNAVRGVKLEKQPGVTAMTCSLCNYLSFLTFCEGIVQHPKALSRLLGWMHVANCQTLVFQCKDQNFSVNTIKTGSPTEGVWQLNMQNNKKHFLHCTQSINSESEDYVYSVSRMTSDKACLVALVMQFCLGNSENRWSAGFYAVPVLPNVQI